jgi:hypothetical protein
MVAGRYATAKALADTASIVPLSPNAIPQHCVSKGVNELARGKFERHCADT